jgi:hypothetical protein
VSSEPTVMAGERRSILNLPEEMELHILSYVGPEDLCDIIPEVCEWWNGLSKEVTLWKRITYSCYRTTEICRIVQVRCAVLLGFRTN